MNAKDVSEALGQIDEQFVTEAVTYAPKQNRVWLHIAAVAACLCLLVGLLVPVMLPMVDPTTGLVEAYYSEGIPLSFPTITQGAGSIEVQDAMLTVDIEDFPFGSTEKDIFLSYQSTATMEFTLHNPSDEAVTIDLTLPCGPVPGYSCDRYFDLSLDLFNSDLEKYVITANGSPVAATARLSGSKSFPLSDGNWENEIFSNETNITKVTYKVTELEESELPFAGFYFRRSLLTPKVIFEGYAGKTSSGMLRFGVAQGSVIELYFVGEYPENLPHWGFYSDFQLTKPLEGTMELVSTESMSFLEFAKQSWREDYGISVSDWACALAAELSFRDASTDGFICTGIMDSRVTTYRWFEYSLTLDPGETVVNTITMPVYPSLFSGGNEYRCTYTVDLLSLRALSPDGTQTLMLNTDFTMSESSAAFRRTNAGHMLDLAETTGLTVTFDLTAPRALPDSPQDTFRSMYLILPLGVGVLILLLILWSRRRHTKQE